MCIGFSTGGELSLKNIFMQMGAGLDIELKRFKLQLFPLYAGGTDWFYVPTLNQTIYQHRIGGMLLVYYNL